METSRAAFAQELDMDAKEPRKALGRGLAALIPQANPQAVPKSGLRELPVERIHPNRRQPRKVFEEQSLNELAESIKSCGILQPIVVRRRGDDFELVAGERRWRAATRAGLQQVPAVVKELTDSDALQAALVENIQRRDLDPLEEAEAYSRLIRDYGLDQQGVAAAVGKSRSAIANSLRLLKLPEEILAMLADGRLTAGHARAIMTLQSEGEATQLAENVVERGMSVRDTEQRARQLNKGVKKAAAPTQTAAEIDVEQKLQRALGTRVRLRNRRGKGRIEIQFHSLQQLNDLIERIC